MDYVRRADRSAHLIEVTPHDRMANDDVIPPAVVGHADLDASHVADPQEVFRHAATIGCPGALCQGRQRCCAEFKLSAFAKPSCPWNDSAFIALSLASPAAAPHMMHVCEVLPPTWWQDRDLTYSVCKGPNERGNRLDTPRGAWV